MKRLVVATYRDEIIEYRLVANEDEVKGNLSDYMVEYAKDYTSMLNCLIPETAKDTCEWRSLAFPERIVILRPNFRWAEDEKKTVPDLSSYFTVHIEEK